MCGCWGSKLGPPARTASTYPWSHLLSMVTLASKEEPLAQPSQREGKLQATSLGGCRTDWCWLPTPSPGSKDPQGALKDFWTACIKYDTVPQHATSVKQAPRTRAPCDSPDSSMTYGHHWVSLSYTGDTEGLCLQLIAFTSLF